MQLSAPFAKASGATSHLRARITPRRPLCAEDEVADASGGAWKAGIAERGRGRAGEREREKGSPARGLVAAREEEASRKCVRAARPWPSRVDAHARMVIAAAAATVVAVALQVQVPL
mmetsp:Transcript_3223/g.7522  ORF Transcript_3223/g.7522 Transcript_3223/m.7522 type:complete len:117 (-) Transcript_3223:41-391(-)